MSEQRVDLDTLIGDIFKQKKVVATLHLDSDCHILTEDIKPLVKVFNYLINYLRQLTKNPPDVTLKQQSDGCLLCLVISTDEKKLPHISDQMEEVLRSYKAAMRVVFEEEKYLQILIHFCMDRVPDSVVIEV